MTEDVGRCESPASAGAPGPDVRRRQLRVSLNIGCPRWQAGRAPIGRASSGRASSGRAPCVRAPELASFWTSTCQGNRPRLEKLSVCLAGHKAALPGNKKVMLPTSSEGDTFLPFMAFFFFSMNLIHLPIWLSRSFMTDFGVAISVMLQDISDSLEDKWFWPSASAGPMCPTVQPVWGCPR